jgi:hypothetical protein|tara:strand:+ start:375 stop:548 length:174 start_codon:yes stop_codon:yes gene_type:complete
VPVILGFRITRQKEVAINSLTLKAFCGAGSIKYKRGLPDNRDVQRQVIEFLQTHIIQ